MFLDKLKSEISDKPVIHMQLAADGDWKNARPLALDASAEEKGELLSWVERGSQNIAIEAFFGDKAKGDFLFTGIRIASLTKDQQADFLKHVFAHVAVGQEIRDVNAILETAPHVPAGTKLMAAQPDFAELGTEGDWPLDGVAAIYNRISQPNPASLEDIASSNPALLEPRAANARAFEYAWDKPFPMWLGVSAAIWNGKEFVLSEAKYNGLINHLTL